MDESIPPCNQKVLEDRKQRGFVLEESGLRISVRLFIARFVVHCDTRACLPPSGTFDMTLVVVTVVWLLINAGLTAVTKASLVQNQEFWIFQVRILHDT